MISNIGNISAASPTWPKLHEHGNNSETTWKTHALVVTGYLLIGIALVVASFYMSTIVHPLLALTAPVAPFAAGSLLWSHAKGSPLVPAIFKGSPPPFKGIENLGGNDCWINATMQLLLHIPAFANRIQDADSGFRLWGSHPLEKVFSAFKGYHKKEEINSQELRKMLDDAGVTSSSDTSTQDDPIRFLDFFMKNAGYQLPILYQKIINMKEGKITEPPLETNTDPRNPLRFFDITPYLDLKKPSLKESLNLYFSKVDLLPSGTQRSIIHFMKQPPNDFGVSIPQADDSGFGTGMRDFTGGNKSEVRVDVPFHLNLSPSQIGESAEYACDGFLYHSGKNARSGHWVAVIKKEGRWWLASDSSVTGISEAKALDLAKRAGFVHYSKT